MKVFLSFAVAAVLLVAGCGKKEEVQPAATTPTVKPEDTKSAVTTPPSPPLPPPNVPKDAEVQAPPPGQANDHSNPAFKGGGVPDKNK